MKKFDEFMDVVWLVLLLTGRGIEWFYMNFIVPMLGLVLWLSWRPIKHLGFKEPKDDKMKELEKNSLLYRAITSWRKK